MRKRFILTLMIVTLFHFSVQGQWYYRQHFVNGPLLLTQEQFTKSLTRASSFILLGSGISLGGSILLIISATADTSGGNIAETIANSYEQAIGIICSVSIILTGAAIIVTNAIIMSKIKRARSLAFGETVILDLNPALIMGPENTIHPGLTISVRF